LIKKEKSMGPKFGISRRLVGGMGTARGKKHFSFLIKQISIPSLSDDPG
jgi:hypothetical protein